MRTTKYALDKIKQFEGCRLTAYRDAIGVWTIGYGLTHGIQSGMTITQEEADRKFEEFIVKLEATLKKIPGLKGLPDHKWDAIVSFTYNVGINGLKRSTLLKKLQANPNDETIYQEFLRWDKAKGKKLAGLTRRRQWEAQRWEGDA
jgi:GH24 family phage-related lysozyme (muramidase)